MTLSITNTTPYNEHKHLVEINNGTLLPWIDAFLHPLLWCRKGHNPKNTLQILKSLFGKRLSEYIYNLLFCAYILQSNLFFSNFFSQHIILNRSVLSLWMQHWILRHIYCSCVVTMYNNRLTNFYPYILQHMFHPNNLIAIICCYNILYFCYTLRFTILLS